MNNSRGVQELYVIRHAPAVARRAGAPDAARPLTAEGAASIARIARGLARLGCEFDHLYHSPWLRAVQTADALMPLVRGESVVCGELARAPSPDLLRRLRGRSMAVVGHEPWLSELVSWLVLGEPARAAAFVLKKGTVVRLRGTVAPARMRVLAVLQPKVLRALG